MPTPGENESKSDYIARCVKEVMGEGKDRDQALGQCYGMWREHKGESAYADFAEALMRAHASPAYDAGSEAFRAGKDKADNPYSEGQEHDDWEDGFDDAERTQLWGRYKAA